MGTNIKENLRAKLHAVVHELQTNDEFLAITLHVLIASNTSQFEAIHFLLTVPKEVEHLHQQMNISPEEVPQFLALIRSIEQAFREYVRTIEVAFQEQWYRRHQGRDMGEKTWEKIHFAIRHGATVSSRVPHYQEINDLLCACRGWVGVPTLVLGDPESTLHDMHAVNSSQREDLGFEGQGIHFADTDMAPDYYE